MRYQYVVILRKTSERATDLLSILLCLFSALSFFYGAARSMHVDRLHGVMGTSWAFDAPREAYSRAAVALILFTGVLITVFVARRRRARHATPVRYRYWLLLAALGWLVLTPSPWIGAFFFLLVFLEYQTKRPLEIGFDQDRVVINTLIKQRFDWFAFNNVILKDGLLTLDFKNNRLLQKEVADDDEEDDADEEEFNAYCRSRLAAAATAPV